MTDQIVAYLGLVYWEQEVDLMNWLQRMGFTWFSFCGPPPRIFTWLDEGKNMWLAKPPN